MTIELVGPDDFSLSVDYKMYSDGTPMVKIENFESLYDLVDVMVLRPADMNEFVAGLLLADQMPWIEDLIIPYMPGARQDRSNPTGDVLFTLQSVMRLLLDRFHHIMVLDPHSHVMRDLVGYGWLEEYPLAAVAAKMWQGCSGIIAPDKGAKDRAEQFAEAMSKNVTYASKVRDVSTGRLSGFDVTVEAGKHYLVVDDICDGGGTFVGLGEKIKEQGAFADLYVTHGIFSKGVDELKKYYKNIITTDSRDVACKADLLTIPVVADMVNLIR